MIHKPYMKYVCQLGIISVLTQFKFTQQYTKWNLILSILHRPLGIDPAVLFINSVTTWLGFHYGATDGAKHRLIRNMKIPNIPTFMCLDIMGHFIPMLGWGYIVFSSKQRITMYDIANQNLLCSAYYAFVINGVNGYKQYADYPYWRQVFQAVVVPSTSTYVMNEMIGGNIFPFIGMLSVWWYGKEYLDLNDTRPGRGTPYYMIENQEYRVLTLTNDIARYST